MGLLVKIALWTVGIPLGLGVVVLVGIIIYKMAKKIDWDNLADSLMNRIKSWWSNNGNFWSKRKDWVVIVALAVVSTIFLVGKIRSATTVVVSWNWTKIGLFLLGLAVLAGVIYFSYKKYQETKNDPNMGKKLWKFLRWPVGIVAGALLIYFGAPWVWRNANPIFEAFLAFGGPSKVEPVKRTSEVCIAYAKIEVGVNGSDIVRLPNDIDFKVEPLGDHSYAIEYTTVSGVVGILEMPKTNHEPKWLPERISSFKLISRESSSIEMGIRFYEILQNGKNVKTACPTIKPENKSPEENSKPLRTAGASFFSILPVYVLRRTHTEGP